MRVNEYAPRTEADATFIDQTHDLYSALDSLRDLFHSHGRPCQETTDGDAMATERAIREALPADADATPSSADGEEDMLQWDTTITPDLDLTVRDADEGRGDAPEFVTTLLAGDGQVRAVGQILETVLMQTPAAVTLEAVSMPEPTGLCSTLVTARLPHPVAGDDVEQTLQVNVDSDGDVTAAWFLDWYDASAHYYESCSLFQLTESSIRQRYEWVTDALLIGSHASQLAADTTLSPTEAMVYLFDDLDYTAREIGLRVGSSRSTVASVKQRAQEKYETAPETIAKNKATMRAFEEYSADDILSGEWEP